MYEFWIVDGFLVLYVTMFILIGLLGIAVAESDTAERSQRRIGALAALLSPVWPVFFALVVVALVWNVLCGTARYAKKLYRIVADD